MGIAKECRKSPNYRTATLCVSGKVYESANFKISMPKELVCQFAKIFKISLEFPPRSGICCNVETEVRHSRPV